MANNTTNDPILQQRLREIQEKEARIRKLEAELDDFEADLKSDSKGVRPIKNWPCKSYAFARNAIDIDIPVQFQKAVKKFYSLWWLTVLCTICNWLSIIWWASTPGYDSSFQDYLFATLYVVVGSPLSWMLLYKRFYKAMQANGALGSLFFLFLCMLYVISLHIIYKYISIYQSIHSLTFSMGKFNGNRIYIDGCSRMAYND